MSGVNEYWDNDAKIEIETTPHGEYVVYVRQGKMTTHKAFYSHDDAKRYIQQRSWEKDFQEYQNRQSVAWNVIWRPTTNEWVIEFKGSHDFIAFKTRSEMLMYLDRITAQYLPAEPVVTQDKIKTTPENYGRW